MHSLDDTSAISLDGRVFVGLENAESGEVGTRTHFEYHQEDSIIWAEYSGGEVLRGYLVGTRKDDTLDFRYTHLNAQMETANGVCSSVISILPDGRVALNEDWAWESRPETGSSIVVEVGR